jgi:hypothetical protein
MTYTDLRDQAGRGKRFDIRQSEMRQLLEYACKQGRLVITDEKYQLPPKQTPKAPAQSKQITAHFETI